MRTREENIAVIVAHDPAPTERHNVVYDAVAEKFGLEAFTDETLAFMAEAYERGLLEDLNALPPSQARH